MSVTTEERPLYDDFPGGTGDINSQELDLRITKTKNLDSDISKNECDNKDEAEMDKTNNNKCNSPQSQGKSILDAPSVPISSSYMQHPHPFPLPLAREIFAHRDLLLAQQEFLAQQELFSRDGPFLHGGLPLPLGLPRPPTSMSSAIRNNSNNNIPVSQFNDSRPGSPDSSCITPPPSDKDSPNSTTGGHHWTFEEQFKQLYELSDDTKRKEFLDDLFAFMQRRGTPVNRIPIMAKQVLDLYELFRLVVSKGGLVEVINKKLWREITKGLNLPSSITSAAFTLRTQYMKYLYPYECEKLKLSNPGELQAAIDGNRREGRRPAYPAFECGGAPPSLLPFGNAGNFGKDGPGDRTSSNRFTPPDWLNFKGRGDFAPLESPLLRLSEEARKSLSNGGDCSTPKDLSVNKSGTTSSQNGDCSTPNKREQPYSGQSSNNEPPMKRFAFANSSLLKAPEAGNCATSVAQRSPGNQQPQMSGLPFHAAAMMPPFSNMPMPSSNIRIPGPHSHLAMPDASVMVSMEVNGFLYHGVLFAQPKRS